MFYSLACKPLTNPFELLDRDGSAKMSYQVISLLDPSPVTVGEGGLLTSGTVSGQVALQVTSQEEFGTNQTLVLLVRVCQVGGVHLYCQTLLQDGMISRLYML